MITRGRFSRHFWLGMGFLGNILPILSLLTGGSFVFALAGGVLTLIGLYIGEIIQVKAPPLIPLS